MLPADSHLVVEYENLALYELASSGVYANPVQQREVVAEEK
jgi:hypothetical protein